MTIDDFINNPCDRLPPLDHERIHYRGIPRADAQISLATAAAMDVLHDQASGLRELVREVEEEDAERWDGLS